MEDALGATAAAAAAAIRLLVQLVCSSPWKQDKNEQKRVKEKKGESACKLPIYSTFAVCVCGQLSSLADEVVVVVAVICSFKVRISVQFWYSNSR